MRSFIFNDLHQTASSSSTRKYIYAILKSLQMFLLGDINEGFEKLLSESKWSYRMKNKFRAILKGEDFRCYG